MSLRETAKEKADLKIEGLQRQLEEARRERDSALLLQRELDNHIRDLHASKFRLKKQRPRKHARGKTRILVAFGDTHGASICPATWSAFRFAKIP